MTEEKDTKILSDLEWAMKLAEEAANFPRLKDAFAMIAERYPLFAKQYWLYFSALTDAGFTPEQAMKIIIVHGYTPR